MNDSYFAKIRISPLLKKTIFVFIWILSSVIGLKAQTKRVEILNSETLQGESSATGNVTKLKGNVQLKSGNTLMFCDSAWVYDDSNLVDAYSNVRITDNDTVHISGQYLHYNGNTRKSHLEKEVVLQDPGMSLQTQILDYDLATGIGQYNNQGLIVSKDNRLTSMSGYYYSRKKEFFFKKNVILTNPDYVVTCDTLMYNTQSRISTFLGPTKIISKTDSIYCENGWYNTAKDQAQFSEHASVSNEKQTLNADSLYYDGKLKVGKAYRNIFVNDREQGVLMFGNYGETNSKTKKTWVTKQPYAIKLMEKKDSLFIYADSLYLSQGKKRGDNVLKAFHHARIYKTDMQAVCDSLVFLRDDSVLWMYSNPVLWNGPSQITSDTMQFFVNNGKIDSFRIINNGFVAEKIKGRHFNQIKGKDMFGYFDSSELSRIFVQGNGQCIYYAKEDSIHFVGVNQIDCSEMIFRFKTGKLIKAVFIKKPDAVMHPLDDVKPEKMRLKGFHWKESEKPQKVYIQYKR